MIIKCPVTTYFDNDFGPPLLAFCQPLHEMLLNQVLTYIKNHSKRVWPLMIWTSLQNWLRPQLKFQQCVLFTRVHIPIGKSESCGGWGWICSFWVVLIINNRLLPWSNHSNLQKKQFEIALIVGRQASLNWQVLENSDRKFLYITFFSCLLNIDSNLQWLT